MKILQTSFLFLLTLVIFGLSTVTTYAWDNIYWYNSEIELSYDYSNEELDIDFTVPEGSRPSDDYQVKFKIKGKTYLKNLSYSSSRDELYVSYSIDIAERLLQDSYDIDFEIINKDDNDEEYDNSWNIFVDNYRGYSSSHYNNDNKYYSRDNLDWGDVEITSIYRISNERLTVKIELADMYSKPKDDYFIDIEFLNKKYKKKLVYSTTSDRLYASFTIDIDKEDLYANYGVYFSIINDDSDYIEYEQLSYNVFVEGFPYQYNNTNTHATSPKATTTNNSDNYPNYYDYTNYSFEYSDNIQKIYVQLKKTIDSTYSDVDDKITYLQTVIDAVKSNIKSGSGDTDYYKEMDVMLSKLMSEYKDYNDQYDYEIYYDSNYRYNSNYYNNSYYNSNYYNNPNNSNNRYDDRRYYYYYYDDDNSNYHIEENSNRR